MKVFQLATLYIFIIIFLYVSIIDRYYCKRLLPSNSSLFNNTPVSDAFEILKLFFNITEQIECGYPIWIIRVLKLISNVAAVTELNKPPQYCTDRSQSASVCTRMNYL